MIVGKVAMTLLLPDIQSAAGPPEIFARQSDGHEAKQKKCLFAIIRVAKKKSTRQAGNSFFSNFKTIHTN